MKKGLLIIFVSTGRCGTTRIAEILQKYLPAGCTVVHQTRFSQLANVLGNIQYHFPIGESLGDFIYNKMIPESDNFISVDPLASMIVPRSVIMSEKTYIIHLVRDSGGFSKSMFRLTRKKNRSFIAHNFIPFWQPYLVPMENLLSKKILFKYRKIHKVKNEFFKQRYSTNPHYVKITMEEIFQFNILSTLLSDILDEKVEIPEYELLKKTNQTQA